MTDFGLTTAGLSTPRFPEARALVVAAWSERFGSSVTSSDSPDGLMIDTVALFVTLAWQGLQATYANGFFRTAKGQALNLIVDLFGTAPAQPEPSTVDVVWYGTAGTVVLASRAAIVEETSAVFEVDADATIPTIAASSQGVIRVVTAVSGDDYVAASGIDSAPYEAQPGDTVVEIAEGVRDAILNGTGTTSAWPDAECSAVFEQPDGSAVFYVANLPDPSLTSVTSTTPANMPIYAAELVPMTATVDGPTPSFAGTLSTVSTPVVGVQGVFNPEDAVLGSNLETPQAVRNRHLQRLNAAARRTPDAIRGRVLDVDGVRLVFVRENPTAVVDVNGLPAHSFETFVLGGDDAAIAAAILGAKPIGIQAYGTTVVNTADSQGTIYAIGLSRPVERYAHIRITITTGEGWSDAGEPATAIQQAVAAALDDGGTSALTLGSDLYRLRVARIADQTIDGIASVLVELDDTAAPGDPPTLVDADLIVPDDTLLLIDSSRVEVVIA